MLEMKSDARDISTFWISIIIKMKTKKRYEVMGMMEWHPEFKVGRTRLQVSFTGGHECSGAHTPAVYETTDPVVQAVIERSNAYISGRIRLGNKEDIPESADESEIACKRKMRDEADGSQSADEVSDSGYVFEYEDEEEVYSFLKREKGVPTERLCTRGSYKIEAERLGIILRKK